MDFNKLVTRNTSILCTSKFNYSDHILSLLNKDSYIISKNSNYDNIPHTLLEKFHFKESKDYLTNIDQIKLNILSSLTTSKKVIVFFDVLTYVDYDFKIKVIAKLKSQDKIIINYTSEIEETLLMDYLVVIHDNKIIMEGNTKDLLKEEVLIKKLGFNLPFIIELSNNLQYYNLVNKTYFDLESLVNDLWK